jgi:hypothetical protein
MKKLLTYQQLNESNKATEVLENLLQKFDEKIDSEKLFKFLLPFKKEMDLLCRKYYKNGTIDADQIHSDLKSFSLMKEERGYEEEFDEDEANNVILRYLYKFFFKWPKNFVTGLWEFFHTTVIETWQDDMMGKFMSMLMLIVWILAGILVYIISVWSFLFFDVKMNGLTSGRVEENRFEAAHTERYSTTVWVGKVPVTTWHTRHVPDRWHIQVIGKDGRVEDWVTYNTNASNIAKPGNEVQKDDNWSWENTVKR